MLFYSGYIPRIGDVDEGNTVMDYLPAERERGITIQSAAITFPWRDHRLNLIDTPGHADFTFEVERAIRVLDGAVTILDAVAGVEAQTEKVWRQANARGIPKMVFVNKMDRVGAGFGRTVREVGTKLRSQPLCLQLPIFEQGLDQGDFVGVVDLVQMQCLVWPTKSDGKDVTITSVSEYKNEQLVKEALKAREALVETLSDLDEDLFNSFLELEDPLKLPIHVLKSSIRRQCVGGKVIPVLAGASFRNIGVQPLLDAIIDYLPAPIDRPAPQLLVDGRETTIVSHDHSLCALAFKVVYDQMKGPMIFVRVYAGTLTRGSTLFNSTTKTKERAMKIMQMYADEAREVDEIRAGNIGVVLGLKETRTGDTLVSTKDSRKSVQLQPIEVPPPVFIATVDSSSDSKGLEIALDSLLREDPSLHLNYDEDTGQTLLSGMGELHLEIAANRLIEHFKAKAEIGKLRIGYRETVITSATVEESFDRILNNKRALVNMKVELDPVGNMNLGAAQTKKTNIFDINGNTVQIELPKAISTEYTRDDAMLAIRNGALVALSRGLLSSYPIHSTYLKVSVSNFEPETSLGALTSATRAFTLQALDNIGTLGMAILEPIMAVSVTVDEEALGSVMNDLSGTRGGQVLSLSGSEEVIAIESNIYSPPDSTYTAGTLRSSPTSVIQARVPLKEMMGYSRALRSLTGGRGSFVMTVDQFEKMSKDRVKKIDQ